MNKRLVIHPFEHILLAGPAGGEVVRQAEELAAQGYRAQVAHSWDELCAIAGSSQVVELLLLHLDPLKDMDGAQAGREFLRLRQAPVVFLVSQARQENLDQLRGLPGYGLLPADAGGAMLQAAVGLALQAVREQNAAAVEAQADLQECVAAAETLELEAQELHMVFNTCLDRMCVVDNGYRLSLSNQAFQVALHSAGRRGLEAGGSILSPEVPVQLQAYWKSQLDRALSGETFSAQSHLDRQDGEHTLENTLSPLYDDAGRIRSVLVVSHNT